MYSTRWDKKSRLDYLINNLRKADGKTISVGYFNSQGKHPTERTDMTFVQLIAMHELREDSLRRPVLSTGIKNERENTVKKLNEVINGFLYWGAMGKSVQIEPYLERLAKYQVKRLRTYFGKPAYLKSNTLSVQRKKGANAPMVETSALRDHLAYQIGSNGRVVVP